MSYLIPKRLPTYHLHRRIGTIVMRVIYGYYPKSASDPLLACPIRSVINFGLAFQPGFWLVDSLPFR